MCFFEYPSNPNLKSIMSVGDKDRKGSGRSRAFYGNNSDFPSLKHGPEHFVMVAREIS